MPGKAGIPAPFSDLIDHVPAERRSEYSEARRKQVEWLGESPSAGAEDWLVDELSRRRSSAGSRVTQVTVAATLGKTHTLVAPGELTLLDRVDDGAARAIIEAAGFVERKPSDGAVATQLAGRITRFIHPRGATPEKVSSTVAAVRAKGFSVSPGLVAALQAPPPHPTIVIKSLDGPTPVHASSAPRLPEPATGGDPIKVAVIDTGIVERTRSDGWLNDVRRRAGNIDPLDAFPEPNERLDFAAGHGTFTAGIVRQVDPAAEIVVYAALDSDGVGSEYDVAVAMLRAVRDGAQVVNLSLGMRTVDDEPCVAIQAALAMIDEIPKEQRPVVVASAGNYGTPDKVWPAAFPQVISVASLKAERPGPVPSTWSSHGPWVSCSTVAEGIVSTFVHGKEDPDFGGEDTYPLPGDDDSWALWTGTSFAAPQISGAISRWCREHGTTPKRAVTDLLATGVKVPGYGRALRFLAGT